MDKKIGDSPFAGILRHISVEHLVAGISGGVVSTLILHPLDLVKIRFQVNEGTVAAVSALTTPKRPQYNSIRHAFSSIYRSNGFVGLYQGVTPNVWGAGLSWGFYFFFYNSLKTHMQDGDPKAELGPVRHMLAAAEAGFLTLTLTNPIWVVKTRLCLQYEPTKVTGGSSTQYKGMIDALHKVYQNEGVRGMYKGFLPGVFGISHGAIQFMAYEELKNLYNNYYNRPIDYRLTTLEYLAFAALSKLLAASVTYPYQVVRSRMQEQHRVYGGVRDLISQIYRLEGVRGFYKGSLIYFGHVTPNICIVFLMYEYIVNHKVLMELFEFAEQEMTLKRQMKELQRTRDHDEKEELCDFWD